MSLPKENQTDIDKIDLRDTVTVESFSSPPPKRSKFFLALFMFVFLVVLFFLFYNGHYELIINSFTQQSKASNAFLNKQPIYTPSPTPPISASVIGFLPSWSVANNVSFVTGNLTQIIYFGLNVNADGQLVQYGEDKEPTLEWYYFTGDNFTKVRKEAAKTKTKILVAVKNFDNKTIDGLISNPAASKIFTKNILALIKQYQLDGVNLDFEYFTDSTFPTVRYLNSFLEQLATALKAENPNLILSIDINASVIINDPAYDMVKIGEVADQIIVMGYDFHTVSSSSSGPVAPLFAGGNEHSVTRSLDSLIGRVPPEKTILAIPLYGYEWQTVSGVFGSQTINNSGALATYKRVQELLSNRPDIVKHWDMTSHTPWITYNQSGAIKQIYYEDKESINDKIIEVGKRRLAGIGLWALGYEGEDTAVLQDIAQGMQGKKLTNVKH